VQSEQGKRERVEQRLVRVGEARRTAEVQSADLSAALQASEAERRAGSGALQ